MPEAHVQVHVHAGVRAWVYELISTMTRFNFNDDPLPGRLPCGERFGLLCWSAPGMAAETRSCENLGRIGPWESYALP